MQDIYGNTKGRTKQVYASSKVDDDDDDDDNDYENTNPCESPPIVPSRMTRTMKDASKNNLILKGMDKSSTQTPPVLTNAQKTVELIPKESPSFQPPPIVESSCKVTKLRLILGVLILLIIMFLILGAVTGLLLKYYLDMSKEMSHLNNHEYALLKDGLSKLKNRTDDQQQMVLENARSFKKDLENIKQIFFQNINGINKTLGSICGTCPSGWKLIGIFCYYFSTTTLSWDDSRDECIKKRSTLVTFTNENEMDALRSSLDNGRYWIGLRRDKVPGKWLWLDGSPLSFSNWNTGEPNNLPNEDCAESIFGKWNDLPCSNTMKYVCKKGYFC